MFNKKFFNSDVGLLVLRLALGTIFIVHGWAKFASMGQTKEFFMMFHIPVFLAYVVAFVELVGGLFIIFGMFTQIVGILLAVVIICAVWIVKSKFPLSMAEIDLMVFASAIALAFSGSGKYSLNTCKLCKCGGKCFFCKSNEINKSEQQPISQNTI